MDNALTVFGMIGVSIPQFFFGLVAILVFALKLNWLPSGGRILPEYVTFMDRLPNLILPSLILAITMTAGVMRLCAVKHAGCVEQGIYQDGPKQGIARVAGQFDARFSRCGNAGYRSDWISFAHADWRIGGYRKRFSSGRALEKNLLLAVQGQNIPLVMMIALIFRIGSSDRKFFGRFVDSASGSES